MWPVYRVLDFTAKAVLSSPLHFILSWRVVVIELTGIKSGRRYRIGANYAREGEDLHVMTYRKRQWWRNLRGGRQVTVVYRGRRVAAVSSVEERNLEMIAERLKERDLARRLLFGVRPEQAVLVMLKLRPPPGSTRE